MAIKQMEGVLLDTSKKEALGEKAWYAVSCYSTHEKKVKENLERRIESMGLKDLIERVVVPEEDVPVMKDGLPTGKTRKKVIYSGYVYVEMIMTDYAWYVVRNTPGVTGFVGSSGKGTKPFPIPREQMEPVLKSANIIDSSMYDIYNIGDMVKIVRGPFDGTEGIITDINKETNVVIVEATFFGRANKVEVEFSAIEKI